jgi:ABC-2 type transport system ATP-binding protein
VWEALDLYSSFYPVVADWQKLIEQLGLEEKRSTPFGKLSGGQKQRLFIALALLPNPQLVFLDELTTGLDPQARHTIWELIRDVRSKGKTILLTTHFMEEAERLCDRVAILDHGLIVALDTPHALIRNLAIEEKVIFTIEGVLSSELRASLLNLGRVEVQGSQIMVQGKPADSTQLVTAVVNLLSVSQAHFRELRTEQATLEDVFLNLTGREIRE